MKSSSIEPGLLLVFRLFTAFQFAFLLLSAVSFKHFEQPKHPVVAMALMLGITAFLLVYLCFPGLERRLGKIYLPVALAMAFLTPLAGEWLAGTVDLAQYEELSEEAILFMLFPLLVISWQYNFRIVALVLVGVGLLDFTLASGVLGHTGMLDVEYGREIFGRFFAFLAVGYIMTHLMKEQRLQRQSLSRANAELSHYAATLEQLTISRERNRLAHELHDTLAHTLSGIAVQLEAAESLWDSDLSEAHGMVGKALSATRSGLTETRRALQALRASPLDDLGLGLALRGLADAAAQRAGFALEWQIPNQLPKLSPDMEQGVYRVVQEAFQNIVKHARARQVRVNWTQTDHRLALIISDDGCGFVPAEAGDEQHYGLRGMQERAHMLGGNLEIASQPGQGTTLTLQMDMGSK